MPLSIFRSYEHSILRAKHANSDSVQRIFAKPEQPTCILRTGELIPHYGVASLARPYGIACDREQRALSAGRKIGNGPRKTLRGNASKLRLRCELRGRVSSRLDGVVQRIVADGGKRDRRSPRFDEPKICPSGVPR